MMKDDFACERQSQSEAVRLSQLKREEERGDLFRIDADAVVAHGDDRMRIELHARVDHAASVCVPLVDGVDRVAHDVLECAIEQFAIAVDLDGRVAVA